MNIGALKRLRLFEPARRAGEFRRLSPDGHRSSEASSFLDLFAYFLGQCQKICGDWGKAPSISLRLRVEGDCGLSFFRKEDFLSKTSFAKRFYTSSTVSVDYYNVIDMLPFIEGRFQRSLPHKQGKFDNQLLISSLHATTSTASACNGSSQLKLDNRTKP